MKGHGSVSAWCIDHPVATVLLTFALVLLGVIAFPRLPIAPLPEAEFPTIQVAAQLPGANPETMASSVATPLEVQFSAIPGMTQMTSSSALGSTILTLQFTLDKSIDTAAQEVQAAINTAAGKLPKDMPNLPNWRKVNPADSPVLILSINSPQMPGTEVSDLVETLLARQISQIDGVGNINITGQQRPAIRVQASADKLAAIDPADQPQPGQGCAVRRVEHFDLVHQRPIVPPPGIRSADCFLQGRRTGSSQGCGQSRRRFGRCLHPGLG
jgi:HAE1 family hydrophobic/amphiphilic exporter-1